MSANPQLLNSQNLDYFHDFSGFRNVDPIEYECDHFSETFSIPFRLIFADSIKEWPSLTTPNGLHLHYLSAVHLSVFLAFARVPSTLRFAKHAYVSCTRNNIC